MLEHLDRAMTLQLVQDKHKHQLRYGGEPYAAHAARVARKAEAMMQLHLNKIGKNVLPNDLQRAEYVWHAGQCHDLIEDQGVDYDDIATLCNAQVADYVAALSHDNRLPSPLRKVAYCAQLGCAPLEPQIIKLADVHDNLACMQKLLRRPSLQHVDFCEPWLPDVQEYLQSLRLLCRYGWLYRILVDVVKLSEDLEQKCADYRKQRSFAAVGHKLKRRSRK